MMELEMTPRVRDALRTRRQLLRMRTAEMPADHSQQLQQAERTIAAAVAAAAHRPGQGEMYLAASQGW